MGAGDAGAAALASVLAKLGITLPAAALALVGVLALEVGSSLAVVLARSLPKWMRWTTYDRLADKHEWLQLMG